jgi:hypothetical protein
MQRHGIDQGAVAVENEAAEWMIGDDKHGKGQKVGSEKPENK